MPIIIAPHVHHMFTICSPHVYHMYTICSHRIHLMYSTCTSHVHQMYRTCTPNVHNIFKSYTHVNLMYTKCTLYTSFTTCIFYIINFKTAQFSLSADAAYFILQVASCLPKILQFFLQIIYSQLIFRNKGVPSVVTHKRKFSLYLEVQWIWNPCIKVNESSQIK